MSGKETAQSDMSRVEGSSAAAAAVSGDPSVEAAPLEKLESGGSTAAVQDPKNVQELTMYIQSILQQMQDRFTTMSDQIIGRIDDMAARIDDLEHNINDLMVQAGQADPDRHALQEPK